EDVAPAVLRHGLLEGRVGDEVVAGPRRPGEAEDEGGGEALQDGSHGGGGHARDLGRRFRDRGGYRQTGGAGEGILRRGRRFFSLRATAGGRAAPWDRIRAPRGPFVECA